MAGGGRMIFVLGCLIAVAAVLQCAEAQTTHVVGGSLGWVIPSSASVYPDWAATKTFRVGDTLQFNFVSAHTVAEVNKAAYDACNDGSPIGTVLDSSPARVALNSAGNHYFICTIGQHCKDNQKLAVTVVAGSATAPPPRTTATPPTTTATPPTTTATPPPTSTMTPPRSGDTPSVQPPTVGGPSGSTPPPPSAASSLAVAGFSSVTLLSVAVAFLL